MKDQHLGNHVRYVPLFHFFTLPLILGILIASIVNLSRLWSVPEQRLGAILLFLMALSMGLVAFFARSFALRAQNRAIRAEEHLRYLLLTGKRMDHRLRLGQIIALRFADDEEFLQLAEEAIEKKLSQRAIKQQIRRWRADHHRV